jgi:hypothetical protein
MDDIQKIENKYGLALFRMGLTHLADVGIRCLTDENVAEAIAQIKAQSEVDKNSGVITIMSPQFQCEIVRCAAELAKFGVWDLFRYIKRYVFIPDEPNKAAGNKDYPVEANEYKKADKSLPDDGQAVDVYLYELVEGYYRRQNTG